MINDKFIFNEGTGGERKRVVKTQVTTNHIAMIKKMTDQTT